MVGSVHQTALLHENVTIRCQILTNSSGQLDSVEDPVQFTWSFLPNDSTESSVILSKSDNSSRDYLQPGSGIKYYRPVWTDLVIISVDENDVGMYICTTPLGESSSSDIYVLGKGWILADLSGVAWRA